MLNPLTEKRLQASQKFEVLRPLMPLAGEVDSWLQYARKTLNMTVEQLGRRANISAPTVYQAERNEKNKQINMATLSRLAEAMGFELIYALVPKRPLMHLLKNQATEKALLEMGAKASKKNLTENEIEGLRMELDELIQEFLKSKKLWD